MVLTGESNNTLKEYEYDVCLTFAGEQRPYVQEVAEALTSRQIRVFFDDFERAEMWGKDLYEHLAYVYGRAARYCVLFASKEYADKVWTNHERQNAQERAMAEHGEYVLPARFDDTEIPGLRATIRYENLRDLEPTQLADLIEKKLGPRQKTNFLPPRPDRLFAALKVDNPEERNLVFRKAQVFFQAHQRMSPDERQVLYAFVGNTCPGELPANMHISEDLLSRVTGLPSVELRRILGGVHSLGFTCFTREHYSQPQANELKSDDEVLVLEWKARIREPIASDVEDLAIALAMLALAREPYCRVHADEALMDLNFTGLSTETFDPECH